VIVGLRAVKDDAEIVRLRTACRITTAVLADVIGRLAAGMTERGIAEMLEGGFVDAGADAAAFDSIIASGPNGAIPHHEAGGRAIRTGDLVTIDCGARVDGYHADCTRTVAIGEPGEQWRRIHAVVARAQQAGRAAVAPGTTGRQLDQVARSLITSEGHGDHFVHGTGHGVGLEIHEAPAIGERAASTLEAGMTITVEPGIYLSGSGGVRIEDTLLVTDDGSEILTDLPHDLQVL
jgi:Xaa-Pro aminopeptidase